MQATAPREMRAVGSLFQRRGLYVSMTVSRPRRPPGRGSVIDPIRAVDPTRPRTCRVQYRLDGRTMRRRRRPASERPDATHDPPSENDLDAAGLAADPWGWSDSAATQTRISLKHSSNPTAIRTATGSVSIALDIAIKVEPGPTSRKHSLSSTSKPAFTTDVGRGDEVPARWVSARRRARSRGAESRRVAGSLPKEPAA